MTSAPPNPPVPPPPAGAERLLAEQVRLLFASAPASLIVATLAALLVAAVLSSAVAAQTILLWLGALLLTLAYRALLAWSYLRRGAPPADPRRWRLLFNLGAAATGAAWGALAIWLYVPASPTHQTFVLFAFAGMSAGAIASLSFVRSAVWVYLVPMLLPLVVRLLLGSEMEQAMALAVVLFFAVTMQGAMRFARSVQANIRARIASEAAEAELKLREEQARAQYKGIPMPTYTWRCLGEDFELIDYNDAAEAYTRGAVAEVVGRRLSAYYADAPQIRADFWTCLRERRPVHREMPYRFTRNKRDAFLAVRYAFVPPDLVMVHTEDVTERTRAQQELVASRAQLAEAQHIARVGSWEWDLTSNVISWSDEVFRIFGAEPQAFVPSQEHFIAALHPEDLPIMQQSYERGLAGERHFDDEWRIHTLDTRQLKYVQLLGERFFDAEGRMVRMVGTFQDITERKQAELAKNEFISTVSHELRTPLTSLYGSLQLLAQGEVRIADGAPLLEIATRNAERLIALVNDILDMARIGAGRLVLHRERGELTALVRTAIDMNAGFGARFGVRFELAAPGTPLWVELDEGRMGQVLGNLLSNAAKFSPRDSVVEVTLEARDGRARIAVADRGPGIPPDFESELFTRFARADSSNTRATGGTGLGLSIAKGIVDAHGGDIGYCARPGGGSIFYVEVPLAADAINQN